MSVKSKKQLMVWTNDLTLQEASKYESISEWKLNSSGSYKFALRNNLMNQCRLLFEIRKSKWTIQELIQDALKYKTRSQWKYASSGAYKSARDQNILDVVCSHMVEGKRPNRYWSKERVYESAKKFLTVSEWSKSAISAYNAAKKNGWLEECTSHFHLVSMPIGPSQIHKFLLSYDIEYKSEFRFKDSFEVSKKPFDFYLPSFNLLIEYHGKQHLNGWASDIESKKSIQNNDLIKKDWAIKNSYNFLEIKSWEIESIQDIDMLLVDALNKIATANNENFIFSKRELTRKEISKVTSALVFSEEEVLLDARKYKSRSEWLTNSSKIYRFALRHNLAQLATKHMSYVTEHGKWSKEAVIKEAKKYSTIAEWRSSSQSSYVIANRNDWLKDCISNMRIIKRSNGYWTKERILESASQYKTKAEWRRVEPSAYVIGRRNGWFDDINL